MSFCGLIKGISLKMCIVCVRVKISVRLNLFVFGSCFRLLAVILFQIFALVTIQNCTCHNTKLHLSQHKTALVTIQNCTCHNTKLHLPQYKTALVTIQNCTCHNTKLHLSQYKIAVVYFFFFFLPLSSFYTVVIN